jgi:predicted RNA-binding protein
MNIEKLTENIVRFIQEDIEREMKKAIREGKLKLVVETHDGRTIVSICNLILIQVSFSTVSQDCFYFF